MAAIKDKKGEREIAIVIFQKHLTPLTPLLLFSLDTSVTPSPFAALPPGTPTLVALVSLVAALFHYRHHRLLLLLLLLDDRCGCRGYRQSVMLC